MSAGWVSLGNVDIGFGWVIVGIWGPSWVVLGNVDVGLGLVRLG